MHLVQHVADRRAALTRRQQAVQGQLLQLLRTLGQLLRLYGRMDEEMLRFGEQEILDHQAQLDQVGTGDGGLKFRADAEGHVVHMVWLCMAHVNVGVEGGMSSWSPGRPAVQHRLTHAPASEGQEPTHAPPFFSQLTA